MSAATGANAPRWRGEAGFFEIWFAVVLDTAAARAWWFRYTTFAPRVGPARGTVWAAAFAAGRPAAFGKRIVPVEEVAAAVTALGRGTLAGAVNVDVGRLEWSLAFDPAPAPARRGPAWLDPVPAPTHVAHANQEVAVRGRVRLGGREDALAAGRGAQKHIWGTRRVEELFWVYAPALDGDGALEASSVRVRRARGPHIAPVWLHDGTREHRWWSVPAVLRSRVEPDGPGALRVRAGSPTRRLDAVARADPRTLAGFVYRDPAGWDVHVAQSDVATLEGTLAVRPHPLAAWTMVRRLRGQAAVEFHHPEPLAGVRYVGWDATTADERRGEEARA